MCSNIAESWRKRRYEAMFKSKLTDAMMEASETQCWLEFSCASAYLDCQTFEDLDARYEQIIGMLSIMEKKAGSFCY